jgi:HdeA/HdeB family
MKNAVLPVTACILALSAVSASAQTTDMAKIKCSDLSQAYADDYFVVASWTSGYYNEKRGNTKLGEFCKSNSSTTVMKAIEQLSKAKN